MPATFLVAVDGDQIVGRVSIRHELNSFLAIAGGHVGYAIRPAFRRRGYATDVLRQGLIVARSVGVKALLVCDDGNIASRTVIERCGGRLEEGLVREGRVIRRYWIS